MAKNISLMGASYTDVPAVTLPQTGGGTARFDDASVTTATASDVAQGKVFLASDGTITTGTGTGGGELSDDVKTALLECFENVAWINGDGQTYYDALYSALHDGIASISAVYTQTKTVYTTDPLDVLRSDLVVTATYNDGTTRTVTGYVLSGTLTEGTSTVTVTYQGVTDTFEVTTVAGSAYITAVFTPGHHVTRAGDDLNILRDYLSVTYYPSSGSEGTTVTNYDLNGTLTEGNNNITVTYNHRSATVVVTAIARGVPDGYTTYDYIGLRTNSELQTVPTFDRFDDQMRLRLSTDVLQTNVSIWGAEYADLWNINYEYDVRQHTVYSEYADSKYNVLFGGRDTSNHVFGLYQRVNGLLTSLQTKGLNRSVQYTPFTTVGSASITVHNSESSTVFAYAGETITFDWSGVTTSNPGYLTFFNNPRYGDNQYQVALASLVDVGMLTLRDPSTLAKIGEYVPAVRNSDNVIGLYDTVGNVFHTVADIKYATRGNNYCVYNVGYWE